MSSTEGSEHNPKVDTEIQVHPVVSIAHNPKRTWRSYIWDSLDKSPEERRLIFKLDLAVLSFAGLGYLIKYLDQANINNAFVSGMQSDLGLYGDQLNYMQTCWTVGYVVGQIPSNLILTRVRPSIWIPSLELAWTLFTFGLARANTAKQIYILRFFVGLAESGFYPGIQYIIGSWYRSDELAKRSCIFHTASAVASMFSGYVMAAVYHLAGVGGFKGWQWLFIVDGIISLPIALAGYFVLPDMPDTTRAWYFTPEEKQLAIKRMSAEGRNTRAPYTKAKVKSIFRSWHIYLLTLLYVTFNNGNAGAAPVFAQYLKRHKNPKYKIWQINVYPTTTYAVQIVTTLAYAWSSDTFLRGARWPPTILGGTVNIIIYSSLAAWDITTGWRWTCYILMGFGYGLSGLCMAWAHEICAKDSEERALVVASMNDMAYMLQAWLPLLVWKQTTAPEYRAGFVTATLLSALMIGTAFVIKALQRGENRAVRDERSVEDEQQYKVGRSDLD